MTIGWRVMSLNTELWHLVISPRRREYTFNPSNEQPPANYLKYWFSASMSWSWCDLDLSYYKGSSLAAEFATSIRDPCKPSKAWTGEPWNIILDRYNACNSKEQLTSKMKCIWHWHVRTTETRALYPLVLFWYARHETHPKQTLIGTLHCLYISGLRSRRSYGTKSIAYI